MYKKCQHGIVSMGFLDYKLNSHSRHVREDIINATLFAKAVYQSQPTGYGRGVGARTPKDYQFVPWDMLNERWLGSIEHAMDEEQRAAHLENHSRRRILIADEGGLGKTFSACICVQKAVREGLPVLIIAPPSLRKTWIEELERFQIQVSRKSSVHALFEPLAPGVAYVISRGSIQNGGQLSPEVHPHLKDIGLCVLDEAHYGMIAAAQTHDEMSEDEQTRFKQRIHPLITEPRQTLCLTATPMRHGWKDLKALIDLFDRPEALQSLQLMWENEEDDWIQNLGSQWILPLESYIETASLGTTLDETLALIARFSPMVPEALRDLVAQYLVNGDELDIEGRARLVRDLHPLGRYFHCTVRDDLGEAEISIQFRSRTDVSVFFSQNELPLDQEMGGIGNEKSKDCIMNIFKVEQYPSLEGAVDHLNMTRDDVLALWGTDPRREELMHRIWVAFNEFQDGDGWQGGAIVFSHYVGTQLQLYEDLSEHFAEYDDVHLERAAIDKKDLNPKQAQHRLNELLMGCRDKAKEGKFVILVCGDGLAEGQSFLWANLLVNWDLYGGAENIAQRSWRLDRMLPPHQGYPRFKSTFQVVHFVLGGEDRQSQLNQTFRNNRILLGERRFIEPRAVLIGSHEEPVDQEWSSRPRSICLRNESVLREQLWASGNGTNMLEEASEQLWHRALSVLMNWPGEDFLPTWDQPGKDVLIGIPGQESAIDDCFGLLWSGDLDERHALRRLRGKKEEDDRPIPRAHGPPSTQHEQEPLLLLPSGEIPNTIVRSASSQEAPFSAIEIPAKGPWFAVCPRLLVEQSEGRDKKQELYWGRKRESALFISNSKRGPWRPIHIAALLNNQANRTLLAKYCQKYESILAGYERGFVRHDVDVVQFESARRENPPDHHLRRIRAWNDSKRTMSESASTDFLQEMITDGCPQPLNENEELRILIGGRER
jgi:hypothetical protein